MAIPIQPADSGTAAGFPGQVAIATNDDDTSADVSCHSLIMWRPRISRYRANNLPWKRGSFIMHVVRAGVGFALRLAAGAAKCAACARALWRVRVRACVRAPFSCVIAACEL